MTRQVELVCVNLRMTMMGLADAMCVLTLWETQQTVASQLVLIVRHPRSQIQVAIVFVLLASLKMAKDVWNCFHHVRIPRLKTATVIACVLLVQWLMHREVVMHHVQSKM